MTLDRQEIVRGLAEDYATRARALNLKFEDAYETYSKRCSIRDYDCLLKQFLSNTLLKRNNKTKPILKDNEYIISVNDDDCEEGVCKL